MEVKDQEALAAVGEKAEELDRVINKSTDLEVAHESLGQEVTFTREVATQAWWCGSR